MHVVPYTNGRLFEGQQNIKTRKADGIAKAYWKLHDDAKWVDCLQHMLADESHHRDVNHTFATLPPGAENPFIKDHIADFDRHATEYAVSKLSRKAAGMPEDFKVDFAKVTERVA